MLNNCKHFLKIFSFIILFTHCYQTWAKAETIMDLEIEGISIGDSLLKYFSEEEILSSKADWYSDKTYSTSMLSLNNYEVFKDIDFSYLSSDKKYKIVSISAVHGDSNEDNCRLIQTEIVDDLTKMFNTNVIKDTLIHPVDKSGKSKVEVSDFDFVDGRRVSVQCFFFSNQVNYMSGLKLSLSNLNYIDWVSTKAYD